MIEPKEEEETRALPIILMLHGDGTNADIFKFQTTKIRHLLRSHYDFVFVNGPVRSRAGPGVIPFFRGWGPFRCWLKDNTRGSIEERAQRLEADRAVVADALSKALTEVTASVVGVMGFSFGACVAAALLQRTQRLRGSVNGIAYERVKACSDLEFGVFLMGLPPSLNFEGQEDHDSLKIRLPTIHVHGLRDPWLEDSRMLLEDYCDGRNEDNYTFEFDVGHEINFTDQQHRSLVDAILDVAGRGK